MEEKENILLVLTNDGYLKVMSADTGSVLRSVFLSTITKFRYVPVRVILSVYVTGFAKRDLIHASNFSTLRRCNSACS